MAAAAIGTNRMKRDFARGAAWSTAASWVEQAAAAVIFLVIARLIGVESFGIASMAFAFLLFGEFLVRDTVTEAIVARPEIEDGRLEATFVALTGFGALITAILCGIAALAAALYDKPEVAPLLIVSSPTVLLIAVAGVSTALLRRQMAYRILSIRIVLGVIVGGVVGIAMALNDFGAWSLVGQRLTEIGVNSVLAIAAAGWRPSRWPARADFALLRGLGPRVVQLRAIMLVVMQTPTVLLGVMSDPRAAGIFAFALRLAEIALTVTIKPVQTVAQSAVAALRRQTGRTEQFFLDLTELAALIGFVPLAGLALIAAPLVTFLLGPEWRAAGEILPWLCLAAAMRAIGGVQEAYLLALDRPKGLLRAALAEAVLGLALVALAASHGAGAAAAAVAARAALAMPIYTSVALAPEAIAVPRFVAALTSPLAVAAAMIGAVGLWRLAVYGRIPDLAYLGSAILGGVAVTLVVLFVFLPKLVARLLSFVRT